MNFLKKFKSQFAIALALVLCTVGMSYATSFTVGVEKSNAKPVALVDEDGASINSSNPIPVANTSPSISAITDGRKVVTTAGTAVPLSATSSPFVTCTVQAEEDNTGDIVIGGSGVIADLATREGILLYPSSSRHFAIPNDLSIIYIDSEVNGEGVTFSCQS